MYLFTLQNQKKKNEALDEAACSNQKMGNFTLFFLIISPPSKAIKPLRHITECEKIWKKKTIIKERGQ